MYSLAYVSHVSRIAVVAVLAGGAGAAHAQLSECVHIAADAARLACYDALAQRVPAPAPASALVEAVTPGELASPRSEPVAAAAPASAFDRAWELAPQAKTGVLQLMPYKPVYALVHVTNRRNEQPQSPTRPFVGPQTVGLQSAEVKAQLSFKTKLAENVLGSRGDLWFGYTQRSFWQAGNQRYSSLFRETDYEPEAIYVHPVQFALGALNVRYLGLSLNHQSNGQARPYSRSWNRLIGDVAMEYGDWAFHVRPWTRVFESRGDRNDNPGIENYVGRGELTIERRAGGHVLSATLRHSLRAGSNSRGSAQGDWAFPIAGGLRGHLQLFSGYGESLIDYNHRQTTIGLGVSFFD